MWRCTTTAACGCVSPCSPKGELTPGSTPVSPTQWSPVPPAEELQPLRFIQASGWALRVRVSGTTEDLPRYLTAAVAYASALSQGTQAGPSGPYAFGRPRCARQARLPARREGQRCATGLRACFRTSRSEGANACLQRLPHEPHRDAHHEEALIAVGRLVAHVRALDQLRHVGALGRVAEPLP